MSNKSTDSALTAIAAFVGAGLLGTGIYLTEKDSDSALTFLGGLACMIIGGVILFVLIRQLFT